MQSFRSKCRNSGRLAAKACRDPDKGFIAVKQLQNVVLKKCMSCTRGRSWKWNARAALVPPNPIPVAIGCLRLAMSFLIFPLLSTYFLSPSQWNDCVGLTRGAISSVVPPHCSSDDVHTHSATARRHGQRSTVGPWRPLARSNLAFTSGCLTYTSIVNLGCLLPSLWLTTF
jgi:hypothetical protein